MNLNRIISLSSLAIIMGGSVAAQSYYDDDIYFDASKAPKQAKTEKKEKSIAPTVIVADYPSADSYTAASFSNSRNVSVDDYNRRGIFATDSLTADTTATDFAYTRRIEQFYNPEIISASNDPELANIYYMNPEEVNIYINTPSGYWGYDYFSPYSWGWSSWGYNPYWSYNPWRWGSSWYWNSWYDPYWAWGPGWGWGPSWAWGPGWGWGSGWGPSWGWSAPYNPRHPGVASSRPMNPGVKPGTGARPGIINGGRHQGVSASHYAGYGTSRPALSGSNNSSNSRPTTSSAGSRPALSNSGNSNASSPGYSNNSTSRPSNQSAYPSTNLNGGRYNSGSYNSGSWGGSGSRNGGFGGGQSSGGARSSSGGRGRH